MYKLERNGWNWVVRDEKLLDSWFDNYQNLMQTNCIKSNDVRSVFTAGNYFVKYDKPVKWIKKLRSLFSPKAKLEFESALELEAASIPVVNYVGWGQSGSLGMVVTEAFPNAVDLSYYWFAEIVDGDFDKDLFLSKFIPFLKTFFESDFHHPDFHLGNILYDPINSKFSLVDVYGIKKRPNMSAAQRYDKYKILFSLRDRLSDDEIIGLMLELGIAESEPQARQYWDSMQHTETSQIRKYWSKRRRQILSDQEKFVTVTKSGLKLRHTQSCSALVDEADISGLRKQVYANEKAEAVWLNSFQLQFFAVPHIRPVAMKVGPQETAIYFEDKEIERTSAEKVEELLKRCRIAGIKIGGDQNNIISCGERAHLDIAALEDTQLFIK